MATSFNELVSQYKEQGLSASEAVNLARQDQAQERDLRSKEKQLLAEIAARQKELEAKEKAELLRLEIRIRIEKITISDRGRSGKKTT